MLKRTLWGLGASCLLLGCASQDGEQDNTLTADEDAGGGTTLAVSRVDEPAGDNCEFGGVAVHSGEDRNGDGEVGGREVETTEYECEEAPVLESRLLITDLELGDPDCPGGGTRMDRGTDANQDGDLDPDEVESSDYLCNPVIEPTSRLVITTLEVGDADCPGGGSKLERGADVDGDGDITGAEVESTDLLCNEVQAPSILARAQELPVGDEDCPEGGIAVLTGPDADGDGLLSDEEATETSLVCSEPELVISCAIPYEWSDEASGCVLRDDWSGEDLSGTDLSNVYLAGIDFSGANLTGADLGDAELRDADLTGANLSGADLGNTSLDGTNLTGVVLDGADLTGVDLTGAVLDGVSLVGLVACPEVLPDGWRCPDLGASGLTVTWPGMSLEGLDLTGADLSFEDLYGLQPLGITGCPASLPDGWVCTELGEFGTSLVGSGADLGGLDLTGVDLSAATDLSGTSFEGSDLSGATFGPGTDLSGASFIDADLSGTSFGTGTNLDGTIIKGANLEGADLSALDLSGVHAVGLLSCPAALPAGWSCLQSGNGPLLAGPGADLSGVDLYGVDLSGQDLTGATFAYGSLEGATLEGANLTGANLTGTHAHLIVGCPEGLPESFSCRHNALLGPGIDLRGAEFVNVELGDVNLSGANLSGANLSGSSLQFVNLTGADLSYTNLTGTDLRGADLSRANLYGATVAQTLFAEAHWDFTTCPDGSTSGVGLDQGCFSDG